MTQWRRWQGLWLPLCAGILMLAAWGGGLPAFRHDWQVSPDWDSVREGCSRLADVYSRDDFGHPNPYVYDFPIALTCKTLLFPLGSVGFLALQLFAAGALAASGARAFILRLGAEAGCGSSVAALIYVASPLFANELAAGHLHYLIAVAALPWALAFTLEAADEGTLRSVMAAAAVWPFAFLTVQLSAVFAFALAILIAAGKNRRAVLAIAAAVAVVELPVVAAFTLGSSQAFLSADRVTIHWERNLSSGLADSFSGFGYFIPYAEQAYGGGHFAVHVFRIAVLVAGAAVAAAQRDVRRGAAIALGCAGALVVAGLNGPASGVLERVFRTIPQAAVFRELYHFAVLPALGTAVALSTLLDWLRRGMPSAWSAGALAATAFAAACALPFAASAVLRDVPRLNQAERAEWSRVAAQIRASARSGAVLFVPNLQPLGPSAAASGTDPEAFPIAARASISQYQPDPIDAWAFERWGSGDRETAARAGIAGAAVRPAWRSWRFSVIDGSLRAFAKACAAGGSAGAAPAHFDELAAPPQAGWRTDRPPARYVGLPEPSVDDDDPRRDWVSGIRWAGCFPELAAIPAPTVFTVSTLPLRVPASAGADMLLVWAPQGATIRDGRSRRVSGRGFLPVRARGPVVVTGAGGPVAISGRFAAGEDPFWWRARALCGRYAIAARRISAFFALPGAPAGSPGGFPLAAEAPGCGPVAAAPTGLYRFAEALSFFCQGIYVLFAAAAAGLYARRTAGP